jgi:hypothetical protein
MSEANEPPADFGKGMEHLFKCPECERLRAQNAELLRVMHQFAECNLTEVNCASLDVANKRIRTLARSAIRRAEEGK